MNRRHILIATAILMLLSILAAICGVVANRSRDPYFTLLSTNRDQVRLLEIALIPNGNQREIIWRGSAANGEAVATMLPLKLLSANGRLQFVFEGEQSRTVSLPGVIITDNVSEWKSSHGAMQRIRNPVVKVDVSRGLSDIKFLADWDLNVR